MNDGMQGSGANWIMFETDNRIKAKLGAYHSALKVTIGLAKLCLLKDFVLP